MRLFLGFSMETRPELSDAISFSYATLLEFMGAYGPSPIWGQFGDLL